MKGWIPVLVGAVAIACSSIGVLYDPDRSAFNAQTPNDAVEYLGQHPELADRGVILNTYEIGDYLIWKLHPEFKVMVASHVHLIPRNIWRDYICISRMQTDWSQKIDHHGFSLAVLNHSRHQRLIDALMDSGWNTEFVGRSASVLTRSR